MRDPSDTPGGGRPEPLDTGCSTIARLKRRADFLHAAKGKRWHGKALSLHAAPARAAGDPIRLGEDKDAGAAVVRVGFTLTKKVGNAVVRNRARRRLREAVRLSGDLPVRAGHDYVVIGRIDALRVPFAALKGEVARAVGDVHRDRSGRPKPRASGPGAAKPRTVEPPVIDLPVTKPPVTKP